MKKKSVKKSTPKGSSIGFLSRKTPIALIIGFFVLFFDQLTKYLVQAHIPRMAHEAQWYPYRGIGIFEHFYGIEFSIVHATNRGSAWGLFAEYQIELLILRILFVFFLLFYLARTKESQELALPLALIATGAIGNIIDYFAYGHVVDMIHFVFWGYDYPVFNVADSAIFIGVWWVFFNALFQKKEPYKRGLQSK